MIARPLLTVPLATCLIICNAIVAPAQSDASSAPVEIILSARKFQFEPSVITVRKDKPVRLLITASDVEHGFEIEELGINKRLKPGAVTVVEFTPTRVGKFRFACSVMCGSGHDEMTGELVVTEQESTAGTIQVTFDETNTGVVVVETGGERLRIDTQAKTITRLETVAPAAAAADPKEERPHATKVEHQYVEEDEPYDYRLVNVPTPKRV